MKIIRDLGEEGLTEESKSTYSNATPSFSTCWERLRQPWMIGVRIRLVGLLLFGYSYCSQRYGLLLFAAGTDCNTVTVFLPCYGSKGIRKWWVGSGCKIDWTMTVKSV